MIIFYFFLRINNKQIFYAFLFNIRNYSPEEISIQRPEAELNTILPRMNNFDVKQKRIWEDKG